MRVLAIIFSMIMTFDFAQGQLSAIYTLKTKDKNVDCNIYFFKEGRYYMELTESATSDIIESLILSYGKYIKKGNLILFKDIVHGKDNSALRMRMRDISMSRVRYGFWRIYALLLRFLMVANLI